MTARVSGLMLATVTGESADNLGRIKVTYDDRPNNPPSNWVFIVRPMASAGFGMWYHPEVGDKVVIGFINGNLDSPYMLGAIYTGSLDPPVTDTAQRVIQSKAGHKIILDDTEGSEAVTIEDSNGNSLVMDAKGIAMKSKGKITIEGAEVVVKGNQTVDIEAAGQLTGKGQPIHLNP